MESNNIFDLEANIEWAEGISNLVLDEYVSSIEHYDVPDDLKDAWTEMVSCLKEVTELIEQYKHEYNMNREY